MLRTKSMSGILNWYTVSWWTAVDLIQSFPGSPRYSARFTIDYYKIRKIAISSCESKKCIFGSYLLSANPIQSNFSLQTFLKSIFFQDYISCSFSNSQTAIWIRKGGERGEKFSLALLRGENDAFTRPSFWISEFGRAWHRVKWFFLPVYCT